MKINKHNVSTDLISHSVEVSGPIEELHVGSLIGVKP